MANWDKHAINYGVGNVMKEIFRCSTRVFELSHKTTIHHNMIVAFFVNSKSCKVNRLCFKNKKII